MIMDTIWSCVQCVVPGNVHICATEGIGNSWGREGFSYGSYVKKMYEA